MSLRACIKRLQKEMATANTEEIQLVWDPNDIRSVSAVIRGPPDSYYAGYEFDLSISVPAEYPMVPPSIKFITKIFHPNIMFEVTNAELFASL